ncbi:MAG: NADH-quinone oxidoreductase subunit NuoF [Acidobacteria bacterium]|nr:MAG: NADH-quinone oxidoreductase subunit NuoF [Acidobacteriota bacterium]
MAEAGHAAAPRSHGLTVAELERIRQRVRPRLETRDARSPGSAAATREVLVCAGGGCLSCHAERTAVALEREIEARGLAGRARVVRVGCMGLCDAGPLVLVTPDGTYYEQVDEERARRIVDEHLGRGEVVRDIELCRVGADGIERRSAEVPFFARQVKIALRNCGRIAPCDLDEYVAADGYRALARVLDEWSPEHVLDQLKRSGLRGRGGAGFPAGLKWQFVRDAPGDEKYVVCNADEGDPGAFMDRSLLEGDPFSVIEGMTIAGRVIGARKGYVYVRAEYPLAIERLECALSTAREHGLLGPRILGRSFEFDVEIRIGAGAFVCGEETALMHSIEGRRGMPRPRPPFPAQQGLWGRPTLLNNVETWANVPPILLHGADWYASIGTPRSKGTKVFALAGDVRNTGLVEVPMGITLREVVDELGGGIRGGNTFKAAQSGGPSGGCIPAAAADVPIDYESLQQLGAIMGSGGLIIMDQRSCMVALARFFLEFLADESCGKCPPCRIGTRVMLNLLERITSGAAESGDIELLRTLAEHIQATSLCGLGQTAPNAVLSTLAHFGDEYAAHVEQRRCPARSCRPLLTYTIVADRCNGCTQCAQACPADAIHGERKAVHVIDQQACIHCGACLDVCPSDAVHVE